MKVLVLSSNNGSGHNSAGRALMEQMNLAGIECEMKDALAFRSRRVSNMIRSVHVNSALHAPWLFKVGNGVACRHRRGKSLCYHLNSGLSGAICRYVQRGGFDTILCTHVFPALAVSHARQHGRLDAQLYYISTDYDSTPHVGETCMDGYFIPHPLLVGAYVENGVPADRIYPTGIPISEKFSHRTDRTAAREQLGLPTQGTIALFMGGSMGFGRVKSLVARMLRAGPEDLLAVVLVGNNQELYEDLAEKYRFTKVLPVSYTDQVNTYMDAADILFTKPGGLSSTEAAAKGIPLVHTDPIPGWETDNAAFFQRLGLCRTGKKNRDFVQDALELLYSSDQRQEMLRCQRENINPHAAADIFQIVRSKCMR
ncbi:MAG: glycosyltransferase [Eubacteriales bacterium]|nr:glycosyltransferase [Eubacteriales bacterium]